MIPRPLSLSDTKRYQDTIENYISKLSAQKVLEKEVEEYLFLKEKNLLSIPCQFILVENQKCRIYFKEHDIQRINKTDWINKNKKEKLQTYLTLEVRKIRNNIYFCQQIVDIGQYILIPEGNLELDEDIEIEAYQLSYEEIDSLYLNYKNIDDIQKLDALFPHLKHYFEWMKIEGHPFEMYQYVTIDQLKTDTATLRIYLEKLSTCYDF